MSNLTFKFSEFNSRRAQRGAEAARIEIFEDGVDIGWLWMSKRDIAKNLMEHGPSDELQMAFDEYSKVLV